MKKNHALFILIAVTITLTAIAGFTFSNKKKNNFSKGFAVVELFTSEGCSSCPSADETVARLLSKNIANVYILAFHVDYWNKMGWKDPFSKAAYSERQNEYASRFNMNSVYTPQVIVNGSSEFVGSDESKLTNTVENNLNDQPGQDITVAAKKSDNKVSVSYDVEGNDEVLLNLALVQPEATISVKRGENGGRTLHHVNIVRAFKTITAKGKGAVVMDLDKDLNDMPLQVIAYTQQKKNFHILGADKKSVE